MAGVGASKPEHVTETLEMQISEAPGPDDAAQDDKDKCGFHLYPEPARPPDDEEGSHWNSDELAALREAATQAEAENITLQLFLSTKRPREENAAAEAEVAQEPPEAELQRDEPGGSSLVIQPAAAAAEEPTVHL